MIEETLLRVISALTFCWQPRPDLMGLMGLELTEHSGVPANMDNLGILQPVHQNTTDNCGRCPFLQQGRWTERQTEK